MRKRHDSCGSARNPDFTFLQFVTIADMPLVKAENLTKSFPSGQNTFGTASTHRVRAVRRCVTVDRGGRYARAGRRIRLRQEHARPHAPAADRTRLRRHSLRWPRCAGRLGAASLRRLRRDMQIIFQDPFGSLDPRMTVEQIIREPLLVHGDESRSRPPAPAPQRCCAPLDSTSLPSTATRTSSAEASASESESPAR